MTIAAISDDARQHTQSRVFAEGLPALDVPGGEVVHAGLLFPTDCASSPSLLRTSKTTYPRPVSTARRRYKNLLLATNVRSPEQQPKAPFTPMSSATKEGSIWQPFERVELPPQLVFESWWNEGKEAVRMHVTFDTATRRCLAGTSISVSTELHNVDETPVEEWDLHVGSELRLLGRRITLKKATDLATLKWLDQQARAMLACKFHLEQELSKFRPVVPVTSQYSDAQRCEAFDLYTHQHMPAGGRVNLRALLCELESLGAALRQHRARLPKIPVAVAPEALQGPIDWDDIRMAAEEEEAAMHRERAAALSRAKSIKPDRRQDFMDWIESIPLASSAARAYVPGTSDPLASLDSRKGGESHGRSRRASGTLSLNVDIFNQRIPAAGGGGSTTLQSQGSGLNNSIVYPQAYAAAASSNPPSLAPSRVASFAPSTLATSANSPNRHLPSPSPRHHHSIRSNLASGGSVAARGPLVDNDPGRFSGGHYTPLQLGGPSFIESR